MQGIQLFEYKSLKESLHKLQESEIFLSGTEHAHIIAEHEKKLQEIYSNYRLALDRVSEFINQFDEHKLSIRRLKVQYKKHNGKVLKRI